MKNIRLIVISILAATLFSSCAMHNQMQSHIAIEPNVILSQNNFHVVKHVSAQASCTYVFGIGGYSQKALKENAVADMIRNAELTGSQAVINVVSKRSVRSILFPLYQEVIIQVQGTVIEYDNPTFDYTVDLTDEVRK